MSKSSKRRSKPQAKTTSKPKSSPSKTAPTESPFAKVKPADMFKTMLAVMLRAAVVMTPIIVINMIAAQKVPALGNAFVQILISLAAYAVFFNFIFQPMISKGLIKTLRQK